jgi:hypothetical protein
MIAPTLIALFLAAQVDWSHPNDNAVALRQGGFCADISWIGLQDGEAVTVDYGPDFNVYRVTGPGDRSWGVYAGFAGQSRPGARLLSKDGTTVYRGTEEDDERKAAFDGYFASDKHEQNHFFGNVFKDKPGDAQFFARVRFGRAAKALCADNAK